MELKGKNVLLVKAETHHVDRLVEIRSTPEVMARWRGNDVRSETIEALEDEELGFFVLYDDTETIVGAIQYGEENDDEDYRHANIDIYVDPKSHGKGIASEAIRLLAKYLFDELDHHRIVIDPAADNQAAIRCYSKVGFKPVGIMRQYEKGSDGSWHDGLLMDLIRDEF